MRERDQTWGEESHTLLSISSTLACCSQRDYSFTARHPSPFPLQIGTQASLAALAGRFRCRDDPTPPAASRGLMTTARHHTPTADPPRVCVFVFCLSSPCFSLLRFARARCGTRAAGCRCGGTHAQACTHARRRARAWTRSQHATTAANTCPGQTTRHASPKTYARFLGTRKRQSLKALPCGLKTLAAAAAHRQGSRAHEASARACARLPCACRLFFFWFVWTRQLTAAGFARARAWGLT